ncbi:hypothetical protein WDW37_10625 [Bdellovibrionota bacterium FG-1]
MKLRDQYDWMVLGDHPGALLSAGLAARLGLSVLVLPIFSSKSLTQSKEGRFVDPESNYLLGLGRAPRFSGLLVECLNRLGILPAELELIQGTHPLPQVLTPGSRVDFGLADSGLSVELQRELGGAKATEMGLSAALGLSEAELLSFWLQLPERLTLTPGQKRAVGTRFKLSDIRKKILKNGGDPSALKWLQGRTHSQQLAQSIGRLEVQSLLSGLGFGISAVQVDRPELPALLHLLALGRTGASFRGGLSPYRDFLLRLAKRLGAHVETKAECRRVFVEKGRFTGVQIAHHGAMVSGGGAIVGCSLSQFRTLVSQGGRSWGFKRLKTSPRPEGWFFTIAFSVGAQAIPSGASARMIWKEPGAPSIEIEIVEPLAYGARQQEGRVVFARAMLPYRAETLNPDYQRLVAARILRQLAEIFPFFEQHLDWVFPEFRCEAGSRRAGELQEVYSFSDLQQIPENLRCLADDQAKGVGSRSGLDGLFVASGESFPELGSLGGTVAALEAVSWLAHRAGLAGPFA